MRVKVEKLLPETRIAVFMELIPHPTKKASMHDWKLIIDQILWEKFPIYLRPTPDEI